MPFEIPLPRVKLNFTDYNLGLTPPLADTHAKIGVTQSGPLDQALTVTSGQQVAEFYGGGPLADAAAVALLQTAPVIMQRAAGGSDGGLVHPGARWASSPPPASPPTFPADLFGGIPNSSYVIEVQFTRFVGVTPTALRYSIDGLWADEVALEVDIVEIGDTGVMVHRAEVQPDIIYTIEAIGPASTLQDIMTALDTLLSKRPSLRFIHIVGTATPELVAAVDAVLAEREADAYYTHAVLEAPARAAGESMAQYLSAVQDMYASVTSLRVSIALDGGLMYNPLTKRVENHNSAWKATAVRPTRPVGEAPYRTRSGPMIGMMGDLAFDAGLAGSSGRFLALRTFDTLSGFYVAHWPTLAPQGSDYGEVQRREVADAAARAGYAAALSYLGDDLRVDLATGRILETEAQAFEAFVSGRVQSNLGSNVSGVRVRLNREENILSTEHISFVVSIIPLGYLKYIDVTVGFENPYLSAAMAGAGAAPPAPTPSPAPAPSEPIIIT